MSAELRRLGKYELRERLARGGQGEVWKAFDTQLRRHVAIKLLLADLQSDPDFVSRFEREAQFIASLHHPNIVQIHDFQLVHNSDSNTSTAYMVMDYIEGSTLAEYIRNTSRKVQFPPAADIVYIFTEVSLAIDYAHGKGMIHRDIKPANIMLDQRVARGKALGLPILTDFGIAKLQGTSADTYTVLGTPLYVSPEQAQGLAGDKRSDLYSLGIILYEMTTGVTPFRGGSLLAILMQHFQELPTPPALINPHIPPTLSEVILKSIAKDPDARFSSASAMTIALAESLNVPVPVELMKPDATLESNRENSHIPLQPSRPLGMTPASLTSSSFQFSSASSFTSPANDGQTPSATPSDSGPGIVSLPNPATNTPVSVIAQPSQVSPPAVPPPAAAQPSAKHRSYLSPKRDYLYIVLITLFVAVVAGSGLLYVFLAPKGTTTPSASNSVVGHVTFLSSSNTPSGSIDEVKITIQHIHGAYPGEQYYAWLQIANVSITPIRWQLTTLNGNLSSSYPNPQHSNLLTNKPYMLLITAEKADNGMATFDPRARLYYASLPATIQNSATFDIRPCPQDGSNICFEVP